MPKLSAVLADEMAMSASCVSDRVGHHGAVAVGAARLSARHIRKIDDTVETPGLVLMISNDGRMVLAVVFTAPETMPSAMPRCTIIVPK